MHQLDICYLMVLKLIMDLSQFMFYYFLKLQIRLLIYCACLQLLKWDKVEVSNVAGEIALLSGLAMWATSLPQTRRKMFELFYYTHHFYILFVVFFVFHVGFSYSCIMLPGFYLFLIDRCLRFLQSQQRISLVSARILPCETIELNFSKSPGKSKPWDDEPSSSLFWQN